MTIFWTCFCLYGCTSSSTHQLNSGSSDPLTPIRAVCQLSKHPNLAISPIRQPGAVASQASGPLPIAARASQQGTEICNTLTGLCKFSWPCGNGGNGSMRYVRRSQVGSGHFDRTYRTRTVDGNMDIHLACSACIDSVTRRQVSRPGYGQPHSLQG